jgi:hypothetical protein
MTCKKCGARGVFVELVAVDGLTLCESCDHDLARMGWTRAEWVHARANHETVQVHNALCKKEPT